MRLNLTKKHALNDHLNDEIGKAMKGVACKFAAYFQNTFL